MKVTVEEEIANPIDFQFNIAFEDGYRCMVVSVASGNGWWIDSKPAKLDYLNAIAGDLSVMLLLTRDIPYSIVKFERNGSWMNIWVQPSEKEVKVYYDGGYRFSIEPREMKVFTRSVVKTYDTDVALDIMNHINKSLISQ